MNTESVPDNDPSVTIRRSRSDLRLLTTGEFSDFTVICGDRQWKVHKAILSKVPYFSAAVRGFRESTQEKITIEEFFEPFEIQWLLEYIYFPYFDPETARLDAPGMSKLETCVRLWQLGDYFHVEGMTEKAERDMVAACKEWRQISSLVDIDTRGSDISFLSDIECAIRRAWRDDLASGDLLRHEITKLCIDFAPFLNEEDCFCALLGNVPEFAVAFSRQALRIITSSLPLSLRPRGPSTPQADLEEEGF